MALTLIESENKMTWLEYGEEGGRGREEEGLGKERNRRDMRSS